MKIYLASSFAYEDKQLTETRKATMKQIQEYLESLGFTVYNPSTLKIPNAWDYSYWDWGQLVFEADYKEIDTCDLVVFVSYGKENNAGSVWEVGHAYGKVPIIMVSMNPAQPESLMVVHSAHACVNGFEGLLNYDFKTMPRTRIDVVES